MANLRANKITSTEVFETTGSVQFDGSGDYLTLSYSNTNFDWWTESFTIEAWVYASSWSGSSFFPIVGNMEPTSSSNNWSLAPLSTGALRFYYFNGGGVIINSTGTLPAGQWNHIAVTHSSSTIRLFINGVLDTTTTVSGTPQSSNAIPLTIGQYNNTSANGHISNLRILKGTALYTSNFTPPTRELTVIPNTVLLCCQSTTRANEERTGKAITVNGNAVANELTPGLLTDRVKSGGDSAIAGSVEFDGTGDWLSIPSSSDFDFGSTNDFTIECWIYQQNRDPTYYTSLFQTDGSNLGGLGLVISPGSSGILQIYRGVFIVSSTSSVPTNGWVHIAATRNSGTTRLFINGVLDGSSAISYTPTFNDIRIGLNPSSGVEKFQGFISNLRVIKGTALYTSNFIPPTRELKRLPGTVLLCCKNSSDPTAEETGKTITPFGSLVYNPPELVIDGAFNSASSWPSAQADWNISGGRAIINSANSGYDYLGILTNRTINGQLYELRFDISSWTAGRLELAQSDSSNIGVTVSGNGSYAFRFRYTGTTNGNVSLYSYTDTTASFVLDNLSLKQVASVPSLPFTPSVGFDGTVTFDGVTKINTPNYFYLPTGNTEKREPNQVNSSYGTRGLTGGGYNGSVWTNNIQYITIATLGNAIDFGDLTQSRPYISALASSTRAVFGTGESNNTLDYVTISSTGNASDFGDSTSGRRDSAGCSSSTRGLFGGGQGTNIIDYITIASTGNAQDFGDLSQGRYFLAACSSPTRGIFAGGDNGAPIALKNINYVTISSTGNATTFGDLTVARGSEQGCSNSIRGLVAGGYTIPAFSNIIDYLTISSTGSATDFGDLLSARSINAAMSSSTRGIFAAWPSNVIEYVSITTQGNALDFGDTISNAQGGCSNGHGGLG